MMVVLMMNMMEITWMTMMMMTMIMMTMTRTTAEFAMTALICSLVESPSHCDPSQEWEEN